MSCKTGCFDDTFSTDTDDGKTTTPHGQTNAFGKLLSSVIAQSKNLADHRDHDAVRARFQRPVDFPIERAAIDRPIIL